MIEELREQGQIKDLPYVHNLVNIIGNIGRKGWCRWERKQERRSLFKVVNFSVASKDDKGNKVYHNYSAYEEKGDLPKDFKKSERLLMITARNIAISGYFLQSC